jgi:hypothetical protein
VGEKQLRKAMREAVGRSDGRTMAALEVLFQDAARNPSLSSAITSALCNGTWGGLVREEIAGRSRAPGAGCA